MKLNDILDEQQLDEIPVGGLGQAAKKIGAKVLNKVPGQAAKSKAGNLAGQADLGDTANNLHKEFNAFLGTQGKKMANATGEDLSAFLKTKKHKTSATIPSGVLQKKQLNDLLMAVSKEALAGQGGTGPADDKATDAPASGDTNNNGTPDSKEVTFVPNQEVMFVGKTGKATTAKVVGKSMDGDESKVAVQGAKGQKYNVPREKLLDPKTKKPFKPGEKPSAVSAKGDTSNSETPNSKVPPKIQKQLDALSPDEKKQLAELL